MSFFVYRKLSGFDIWKLICSTYPSTRLVLKLSTLNFEVRVIESLKKKNAHC